MFFWNNFWMISSGFLHKRFLQNSTGTKLKLFQLSWHCHSRGGVRARIFYLDISTFFHWNKKNPRACSSCYLQITLYILAVDDHAGGNTWVKLVDISYTQLLVSPVHYLQNKRCAFSISFCTAISEPTPPYTENT